MQKGAIATWVMLGVAATSSLANVRCQAPKLKAVSEDSGSSNRVDSLERARETTNVRSPATLRTTVMQGELVPYAKLGWHVPESGDDALKRFHGIMGVAMPVEMLKRLINRAQWSVIVLDQDWIFVVKAGDRLPGIEDDLAIGQLKITPLGGDRGAVRFDPLDDRRFVRLGSGIALPVGSHLEVEGTDWNSLHFDAGVLVLGSAGVEWSPKLNRLEAE
jgi:hypothetical protein